MLHLDGKLGSCPVSPREWSEEIKLNRDTDCKFTDELKKTNLNTVCELYLDIGFKS